jgi:ATP-binding cassette, subfamily C (CFTR/MRP), member 1
VLAAVDVVLQTALVVFWVQNPLTVFSIAAACLGVAAAFGLVTLTAIEHSRSVRPSTLGTVYLGCAVLAGLIQLRSLHHRFNVPAIVWLLSVSTVDRVLLLGLEQRSKERFLKLGREYSPEDLGGVLNRLVFWWLIPIFQRGYRTVLSQEDMFNLDDAMKTEKLRGEILDRWNKCKLDLIAF